MSESTSPLHQHDCDNCRFLGTWQDRADLYVCVTSSWGASYVVRNSSDGPDYSSSSMKSPRMHNDAMNEAWWRANPQVGQRRILTRFEVAILEGHIASCAMSQYEQDNPACCCPVLPWMDDEDDLTSSEPLAEWERELLAGYDETDAQRRRGERL